MLEEFETMKTWEKIIVIILFSVPIIIIAFLIGIVSVNAETLKIPAGNTRLRELDYSNNIIATLNPTNTFGGGASWNLSGSTAPTIRFISGSEFTINNAKLAIFNVKINNNNQNVTNNLGINTIQFANNSCYYTLLYPTIIQQGGTNPSQTQPSIYASVVCPLNSNITFANNGKIVEVVKSGVAVSTVYLSDITIVTDTDISALLAILNTINGNIIDTDTWVKNCYNRLVDLISVEQANRDAIITAMRTLIEGQQQAIIQAQEEQTEAITEKQDEILNYGENEEPEEPSEDIQEANEREEELLSDIEELDLSDDIDIDLEQNSTNWVWTQLTNILQTNAKIFGLIISTLVLGVIKTILGR